MDSSSVSQMSLYSNCFLSLESAYIVHVTILSISALILLVCNL